ncbi:hypothetical protein GCM10027273_09010 [Nocardioides pakistanensis]
MPLLRLHYPGGTGVSGPRRVARGAPAGGQFAHRDRAEAGTTLYFHVAPESAWYSIAEHGLDHTRGESAYADISLEYPPGNYLFTDPDAATAYAAVREAEERDEYGLLDAEEYAVFEVEHDGPVTLDPFADDESGLGQSAVYTDQPIPPHLVRRC